MPSKIPATLAKLTAVFASANVPGLTVSDGPLYDPPGPYLCVGWDGTENSAGVTSADFRADYGRTSDREQFDVSCLLAFWVDSNDVPQVRSDVFNAFDACTAALDADPLLGDVVAEAMVTARALTVDVVETGAVAELRFTVSVTAFK